MWTRMAAGTRVKEANDGDLNEDDGDLIEDQVEHTELGSREDGKQENEEENDQGRDEDDNQDKLSGTSRSPKSIISSSVDAAQDILQEVWNDPSKSKAEKALESTQWLHYLPQKRYAIFYF